MVKNTTDTTEARERRVARAIHYNLSYIVQGAEHGTDGAIVLLHDLLGGAFTWEGIMPALAATGRAVYAIDMLGYGSSDHPWPADTSVWGHADVLTSLLTQLNLTNIVLVGYGLGGGVAQILATRLLNQRVAAVVLIDTVCYTHGFAPDWPLKEMEKSQDPDLPQTVKLEDLLEELRETLPKASHNTDRFSEQLTQYINPWDSEVGKEVLYQHIRTIHPNYINSVASDMKVVHKPVLIIWGAEDQQMPVKYAERLHREIPQSQLVIVPDAAHMVLFDAPEAVIKALTQFIPTL